MKNWSTIISSLIIAGTVIYLAIQFLPHKDCDPEVIEIEVPVPKPYPVPAPAPDPVKVDTSAIVESILASIKIDTGYIQSLVRVDSASIIDQALAMVDTAEILRDYYSTYTYEQTITDDTTMAVELHQSISRNRIIGQSAIFQPLQSTIHYIQQPLTHSIYIGARLIAGERTGIAPAMMYEHDNVMYGVGYDPLNSLLLIEFNWKLKNW